MVFFGSIKLKFQVTFGHGTVRYLSFYFSGQFPGKYPDLLTNRYQTPRVTISQTLPSFLYYYQVSRTV